MDKRRTWTVAQAGEMMAAQAGMNRRGREVPHGGARALARGGGGGGALAAAGRGGAGV